MMYFHKEIEILNLQDEGRIYVIEQISLCTHYVKYNKFYLMFKRHPITYISFSKQIDLNPFPSIPLFFKLNRLTAYLPLRPLPLYYV